MALVTCRECGHEVSPAARACPQCGAPHPGNPDWQGTGYEWRSARTFLGYPLIHVAYGKDARGKLRVAKGIIAIGNIAVGGLAIGGISIGVISLGGLALGVVGLGGGAAGLLLACGGLAVGTFAIGGLAIGYVAIGGGAIGAYTLSGENSNPEEIRQFFRNVFGGS